MLLFEVLFDCLSRESSASMQKLELDERFVPLTFELPVVAVDDTFIIDELHVMAEGVIKDEDDGGDEDDVMLLMRELPLVVVSGFQGRFLLLLR